jgi:hypothetical protein
VTTKGADVAVDRTGSMGTALEKTWTVQPGSLKSRKVTVPVGTKAKERPAVSRSSVPTVAVRGCAVVARTGLFLPTTTCSSGSRQRLGPVGLLFGSPLYIACQW